MRNISAIDVFKLREGKTPKPFWAKLGVIPLVCTMAPAQFVTSVVAVKSFVTRSPVANASTQLAHVVKQAS